MTIRTKTELFAGPDLHPGIVTYKSTGANVTVLPVANSLQITGSTNSVQAGATLLQPLGMNPAEGDTEVSVILSNLTAKNAEINISLTRTTSGSVWAQPDCIRIYTYSDGRWGFAQKVAGVGQTLLTGASGGGPGKKYTLRVTSTDIQALIDDVIVATTTYPFATYEIYPHIEFNLGSGDTANFTNWAMTYNDRDAYPQVIDFVDHGYIIPLNSTPGDPFYGMWSSFSPGEILKKNGIYYLYYIGSGQRDRHEFRSLGVATSTDKITWTPHLGNPIITFAPNGEVEEGIFSVRGCINPNTGNADLYVTRCFGTGGQVNCQIALYISVNGTDPVFDSVVLEHNEPGLVGSGDEITVTGVWTDGVVWRMTYVDNAPNWQLHEVSGTANNVFSPATSSAIAGEKILGGGSINADSGNVVFLSKTNEISKGATGTSVHKLISAPNTDLSATTILRELHFNGEIVNHLTWFVDDDGGHLIAYKAQQGDPNGIGILSIAGAVQSVAIIGRTDGAAIMRKLERAGQAVNHDRSALASAIQAVEDFFEASRAAIAVDIDAATFPAVISNAEKKRLVAAWMNHKYKGDI